MSDSCFDCIFKIEQSFILVSFFFRSYKLFFCSFFVPGRQTCIRTDCLINEEQ